MLDTLRSESITRGLWSTLSPSRHHPPRLAVGTRRPAGKASSAAYSRLSPLREHHPRLMVDTLAQQAKHHPPRLAVGTLRPTSRAPATYGSLSLPSGHHRSRLMVVAQRVGHRMMCMQR